MKWISVKDQQPPKDIVFLGYVLVGFYCEGISDNRTRDIQPCIWCELDKRFNEACNCSGYERDQEYIEVTHWMALPYPPSDIA